MINKPQWFKSTLKMRGPIFFWLSDAFALDNRSLGAFRIGLGLLLLWDLWDRVPDVSHHYTDQGLFPREILQDSFWNLGWHLSLHSLSGDALWQWVLFLVAAIAAVVLTVGWKTRWATITCWILLCSLHARNPAVLHGGDALMRMLLFFSMFLPLGARFSLDSNKLTDHRDKIVNVASFALFIQIAAVYQFSLFFKTDPMWRETFDAVYYTFNYDFIAKTLARWLIQWPSLLKGLTIFTLTIEAIGPVLLILSGRRPRLRTAVIATFMGFHFAIWSTIAIGSFSFVCMLAWIAFLPSAFWLRFAPKDEHRSPPALHGGKMSQTVPAIAISLILIWNGSLLDKDAEAESLPGWLKTSVRTPMLNQRWMAFSHEKGLRWSGWMLIEGTTLDGERYDLLDGRSLEPGSAPESLHDRFPNERWRKAIRLHLSHSSSRENRKRLCDFYIRQWEAQLPGSTINRARLIYRVRWVNDPGLFPRRGVEKDYIFYDSDGD